MYNPSPELPSGTTVEQMMRDFEHPRGGIEERIELDIRRHRKGWGRVVLTNAKGKPLPGVKVSLRQKKHHFFFGANLFKLGDFAEKADNEAFEKAFKQVFNIATVPFYWDTLEPEPGVLRYAEDKPHIERRPPTDYAVDWCHENGIRPKGHWLFCDNFVPKWLPKTDRDLMILLEKRIEQLAERYGGKVTLWDCVNEAFTNPRWFANMGWSVTPQDYVYKVFKLAEKYFPNYTELLYNDGDDIAIGHYSRDNSPMYLLVRELLDRQVRVGGIGIQYHMYHTPEDMNGWGRCYFDPVHLFSVFDQYARLGLPLHITEISLPTFPQLPRKEAEEVQAKLLHYLYRIWFSQEKMESIVWWNLVDKTAYGTESTYDAGLLDAHLQPKPAFLELDRLVNHEWHTETDVVTDERGIADWNGFYGDYDLSFNDGKPRTISLTKDCPNEERITL